MKRSEKILIDEELLAAKKELGDEEFYQKLRTVFGIPCLDFVNTIVLNLPEPCFADCYYCIDKNLRKNTIEAKKFLKVCEKVFKEFKNIKFVTITGGSLKGKDFNYLVDLILKYFPKTLITWNTNGIGINEEYLYGISKMTYINLHRNSVSEKINKELFKTNKYIMTIDEAKEFFGDKLYLRITIDKDFDIEEYVKLGIPLNLNRLLPGTIETDAVFKKVLQLIDRSDEIDRRRRNIYLRAQYKGVSIRISVGDKIAKHIANRKPTYLNVVIVHRSGIVSGSWFEDDKLLYKPS